MVRHTGGQIQEVKAVLSCKVNIKDIGVLHQCMTASLLTLQLISLVIAMAEDENWKPNVSFCEYKTRCRVCCQKFSQILVQIDQGGLDCSTAKRTLVSALVFQTLTGLEISMTEYTNLMSGYVFQISGATVTWKLLFTS